MLRDEQLAQDMVSNGSELQCHIDLDSGNDKHQTGVAETPTDTISE